MTKESLINYESFEKSFLDLPRWRVSSFLVSLQNLQKQGVIIPQKLLGVVALSISPESYTSPCLNMYGYVSANISKMFVNEISNNFPMFARPCPSRPRHGYIESREIASIKELYELLLEVLEDDPNGGVMLMPSRVDGCQWNSIWTPTSLAIGKGNDGATGGKDTLTIPLVRHKKGLPLPNVLDVSKIGKDEDPYIEAISNEYGTFLTQLRAGPKVDDTGDFIPKETIVKNVIRAKGTLLEWEKEIKSIQEGTVVYHPNGSPIDHWAVHCRASNVPIIFSHEPFKGETLTKVKSEGLDPKKVLEGIVLLNEYPYKEMSEHCHELAQFMILNFHQGSQFSGDNSIYFGLSAALMLHLGYAASMGEARHNDSVRIYHDKPGREKVWEDIFEHSQSDIISNITNLTNIHRFGQYHSTGFGGDKWAKCTISIGKLANAIIDLAKEPNENNLNELVKALNICMNQAHNGGWWMNKFTDESSFDYGQINKYHFTIKQAPWFGVFRDIYRATKYKLDGYIKELSTLPHVVFNLPKVSNANINIDMLYGTATLKMFFHKLERSSSFKSSFKLPIKCDKLKLPLSLTVSNDEMSYMIIDANNRRVWQMPRLDATLRKGFTQNDPSATSFD